MTFLDELGGLATLRHVHKLFYDAVFAHPWFSQVFPPGEQERLETQQTDFMCKCFGGPVVYAGRNPKDAHVHIFVTDEMFDERARLLEEALVAAGVSAAHRERWLSIDDGFRGTIVKASLSECRGRFKTDPIVDVPNPDRQGRRAG